MNISLKNKSYQLIDQTYNQHKKFSINKWMKLSLIIVFGSVFLLYRILFQMPQYRACVTDQLHELTFNLNRWILHNIQKVYLLIGQLFIDLWLVAIIIFWILKLENFRYPCSVAVFFIFRTFFLRTVQMPFTSYVVWDSPGVYSLGVPYDHTSDYFFSGHTGTLTLIFCQILQVKAHFWINIVCFISFLFTISSLIIVRVHYTIDIFAGLFIGLFVHSLVKHHIVFFDKIMSLPYRLFCAIRQKIKQICQSQSFE